MSKCSQDDGSKQVARLRWVSSRILIRYYGVTLSPFLVNAISCSFQKGLLSVTQRQGIISLLPKKDKNPLFLKNWRPISLLNCDYKIASKAIGDRIKRVLPKIINGDQSGFMKGRSIAENIFLFDSIINYAGI